MDIPRLSNYILVEEREPHEIPWIRIPHFRTMELPRPVVLVNGAFDILHSGHMKLLFRARRHAKTGTVIVALDSDARVARKPGRPIQTFIERATTLNFMPVDYLTEIDSDRDMLQLVRAVRPDLRLQGFDYKGMTSKYPWIPKRFVRGTGMRTSKIVERILSKCSS